MPERKRQRKVSAARVWRNSWWLTQLTAHEKSRDEQGRASSSPGSKTRQRWHISQKAWRPEGREGRVWWRGEEIGKGRWR